jgi:hypothetical protein
MFLHDRISMCITAENFVSMLRMRGIPGIPGRIQILLFCAICFRYFPGRKVPPNFALVRTRSWHTAMAFPPLHSSQRLRFAQYQSLLLLSGSFRGHSLFPASYSVFRSRYIIPLSASWPQIFIPPAFLGTVSPNSAPVISDIPFKVFINLDDHVKLNAGKILFQSHCTSVSVFTCHFPPVVVSGINKTERRDCRMKTLRCAEGIKYCTLLRL